MPALVKMPALVRDFILIQLLSELNQMRKWGAIIGHFSLEPKNRTPIATRPEFTAMATDPRDNAKKIFGYYAISLKTKSNKSNLFLKLGNHLELDQSASSATNDANTNQPLNGQLHWLITPRRHDFLPTITSMGTLKITPRKGHLVGYLVEQPDGATQRWTDEPNYHIVPSQNANNGQKHVQPINPRGVAQIIVYLVTRTT